MMGIAAIMSHVIPGTFVPDIDASQAPHVTPIPERIGAPTQARDAETDRPAVGSIGSLGDAGSIPAATPSRVPSVRGDTTFKDTVKQLLTQVNDSINTSDQNSRDLASGKTNDVNAVVTSVEEANLALQYTMAIRTKLLEAYTTVQTMAV